MPAIEQALSALIARRDAPGGVASLFRGKDVIWSGASGMRRFGASAPDQPMTIDTKARVASVSKVATALTLIQLAEEGKIDLDSDCSPALGFKLRHPKYPDSPITPRMVLSHTSGVRDGDTYQGKVGETLEDFFKGGGKQWSGGSHWAKLDLPLGHFAYSNLGMGLVAQMAERATGERFDLLAKRLVFDPLGIDAGFNWSGVPDAKVAAGATLYRRKGGEAASAWEVQVDGDPMSLARPTTAYETGKTLADYVVGTNGLLFSPQGGLRASLMDLVKIGMALTGSVPLLDEATRKAMFVPEWTYRASPENGDTSGGAFQGFGTGVHRLLPGEGCPIVGLKREMIGHYGEAYGLLAGLWVDPETSLGFAYFVTGSLFSPPNGKHSGVYALEEEMMQAAAQDLGLV
jgi:CubicO group peptidase (beta-lactamase class C family)